MKGRLKKFTTLALASGISLTTAFSFAGCELFKSEEKKRQEELFENAVAEVTELLTTASEGMNFTLTRYSCVDGKMNDCFKFDNDLVEWFQQNAIMTYHTYHYIENGVIYEMSRDDDGYWKTEIMEKAELIAIIESERDFPAVTLKEVDWRSYNEEENLLTGRIIGEGLVQMRVEDGKAYYLPGDKRLYVFSDIGTTTVTLPENVVDNTDEDLAEIEKTTKLAEIGKEL